MVAEGGTNRPLENVALLHAVGGIFKRTRPHHHSACEIVDNPVVRLRRRLFGEFENKRIEILPPPCTIEDIHGFRIDLQGFLGGCIRLHGEKDMLRAYLLLAMIVKPLDSGLGNFPLDYKCGRKRHPVIPKLADDVRVIEEIPVVGILKLQLVICQKFQKLFPLLRCALARSIEACAVAHIEILEVAHRDFIGADF